MGSTPSGNFEGPQFSFAASLGCGIFRIHIVEKLVHLQQIGDHILEALPWHSECANMASLYTWIEAVGWFEMILDELNPNHVS